MQADWTNAKIATNLNMLDSRPDASVHCKIARCTAVLCNRVIAVKAVNSKILLLSETEVRDLSRKREGDGRDTNSSAGLSSVGRSSSS